MATSASPERLQLQQIKMRYSFFFDALRALPKNLSAHRFQVSLQTRAGGHVAVSPLFQVTRDVSADGSTASDDTTTSISVNFVHHYECTLVPAATLASYKPHLLRIQVRDDDADRVVLDAEVDLAQHVRNDKVPMTKLHIKALEPPMYLALNITGISLALYKQQQAVVQEAGARDASSVRPADHPVEEAAVMHEAPPSEYPGTATASPQRERGDWLQRAHYDVEPVAHDVAPAAAVQQAKERDDRVNDDANRHGAAAATTTQGATAVDGGAIEAEGSEMPVYDGTAAAARSGGDNAGAQHGGADDQHGSAAPAAAAAGAGGGGVGHQSSSNKGPASKGGAAAQPTAEAIALAAAVDAQRRRDAKRARAEVRYHEYCDRYATASTVLQRQVHSVIEEIKQNILTPARTEVDGVKCTMPRAAVRAVTALCQYADHALKGPKAAVDLSNMEAFESDDEADGAAVRKECHHEAQLPPEAALLVFVHDLVVTLRWDVCPTNLDPRHTGAWLHTLLHLLNAVLQLYLVNDVNTVMPAFAHEALENASKPNIPPPPRAKRRRWWRSLRLPRILRRDKTKKNSGDDADAESMPGGHRTVVTDELCASDRAMGLINRFSTTFYAAAMELDAMWEKQHERLVAPAVSKTSKQQQGAAANAVKSGAAAFPILSTVPTTVFWPPGRAPAPVHLTMTSSPLWTLLMQHVGTSGRARSDGVELVLATLALELDMALHDLLCQIAEQARLHEMPDVAVAAFLPSAATSAADGQQNQQAVDARRSLRETLQGLYDELVASSASAMNTIDRSNMWDSPLSVAVASDIIALALEQMSIAFINENHRRISVNLVPATTAAAGKKQQRAAAQKTQWQFQPFKAGLNAAGELVCNSADDGLALKQRLDEIEAWLDSRPVPLGPACRAALLPLRSLCDALVLPSEVFLEPAVRHEALLGLPNAMQRAVFASMRASAWEHEDDARVAAKARTDLATTHLCPPPHYPAFIGGSSASSSASANAGVSPDAVALPYCAVYRTFDRDFSFLDFLSTPASCFGATEAIDALLRSRQEDALAAEAAKGASPAAEGALVRTELLLTQLLCCLRGQRLMQEDQPLTNGAAVTALWDTPRYRESIGLSSTDAARREEQLYDPRRGNDAYLAPRSTLESLLSRWDQSRGGPERKGINRAVADAILAYGNVRRL